MKEVEISTPSTKEVEQVRNLPSPSEKEEKSCNLPSPVSKDTSVLENTSDCPFKGISSKAKDVLCNI